MTELARCNGVRLVEEGDRLLLIDHKVASAGRTGVVIVHGISTVAMVGGIASMFEGGGQMGMMTAVIGMGGNVVAFMQGQSIKAREAASTPSPRFVFDREAGVLRSRDGRECPLADVRIQRMNLGHGVVAICWPDQTVVARGNSLGDTVDAFDQTLRGWLEAARAPRAASDK